MKRKKETSVANKIITQAPVLDLNSTDKDERDARVSLASNYSQNPRSNVSTRIYNLQSTYNQRFPNISERETPFSYSGPNIAINDAIDLMEKAYFNFPLLRLTIDTMVDLSNQPIYLTEGNKKVNTFLNSWLEKIDLWSLKEKFFREFYRSSNVFFYRFDGIMDDGDVQRMSTVFGAAKTKTKKIPIRYQLLNSKYIRVGNNITFISPQYFQVFTALELEKLRNPKTPEDKQVFDQLSENAKQLIKGGGVPVIPLDITKLTPIFNRKQDYEPFAVPIFFAALDSIDWKLELLKMDRAIAKTGDWLLLLVTMGDEKIGANPKNIEAMQKIFATQSIKRAIIADYTTKAQWTVPELMKIMGPEKYQIVNEDLRNALGNVISGDDKFANAVTRIKIFMKNLENGQQAFLNQFLIPEIKRVCRDLGFKNYPIPQFKTIDLQDELQYAKIYAQLAQIGYLTPEQTFEAMKTARLPEKDDLIEQHAEFKQHKDKGLFMPTVNAPQDEGRPSGSKAPQSSKKVKPSRATLLDFEKIKQNIVLKNELDAKLENIFKKKFKLKELAPNQYEALATLSKHIVLNEKPENWVSKAKEYAENPKPIQETTVASVKQLENEFETTEDIATILFHSQYESN